MAARCAACAVTSIYAVAAARSSRELRQGTARSLSRLSTAPSLLPQSFNIRRQTGKLGGDVGSRMLIVRALEISGPGAIDSPLMISMREKIMTALETEQVSVTDVQGDGRHVSIEVVSSLFEGKRSVDRQRMVYKAIWEELQEVVHAVDSLTTKAPSEIS